MWLNRMVILWYLVEELLRSGWKAVYCSAVMEGRWQWGHSPSGLHHHHGRIPGLIRKWQVLPPICPAQPSPSDNLQYLSPHHHLTSGHLRTPRDSPGHPGTLEASPGPEFYWAATLSTGRNTNARLRGDWETPGNIKTYDSEMFPLLLSSLPWTFFCLKLPAVWWHRKI